MMAERVSHSRTIIGNVENPIMDPGNLTKITPETNQTRRNVNDSHQSTYEGATRFSPRNNWDYSSRKNRSTLVVEDPSTDTKTSLLGEMMATSSGRPLTIQEEPGEKMETIIVLLLFQDKTHHKIGHISHRNRADMISQ